MDILLVEDDRPLARHIAHSLEAEGYHVTAVHDGGAGLSCARQGEYAVLIADRMLPVMDGLTMVRALRAAGRGVPTLFLTTLDGLQDRVNGLNAGGDDYLPKPFAMAELVARVGALARRGSLSTATRYFVCGNLKVDRLNRTVTRADVPIVLQPREYALLDCLLRHAGGTVTRTMLLQAVWNLSFDPGTNVVESHLSRLRAKIDRPFDQPLIRTVRGAGYRISDA